MSENSNFLTAKEVEEEYGIDLITAETIRAGLIEVTRHMFRTLKESAFSNPVREMTDFGVCVHMVNEDNSTELISVTEGCTHFAFTHPHMMNFMVDEWGIDNFGPGDTIVCNDPWRGSIHMPDVNLFRPVFWEGKPILFLSDASHLVDIGGPVPGGFNTSATEVFAEGLRIPPMLITSNDKPVRSTINLILENTRTPQHNLGDLRALFGTMKVGEARLLRLLERYGADAVIAASRYLLDLSERRMRAAISRVPDGKYEAEEWVDDDGLTEDPIRVAATATVSGDHMEIDYTGTDRQPLGSIGSCWEETNRMLVGPKVVLDPEHPMNSGMMRCFHVVAPAGSVVMAAPPTSNCQHADLAAKVADLGLRLCGQMVPERAVAADGATTFAMPLGGIDDRPGRGGQPYGGIICQGVGWGGTANGDGISFCCSPIYGISSSTVELMERDTPLMIRGTDLQIDSAGAGKFRSGFANSALFECTDGEMIVTTLIDSGRKTRWGVAGGGEGATAYVYRVKKDPDGRIPRVNGIIPLSHLTPLSGCFNDDGLPDPEHGIWSNGTEFHTNKLTNYVLKEGETLLLVPAAGGGYGEPLERDPELVRQDVWNEKVSLRAAEEIYGVVLDANTLEVQMRETGEQREKLASDRGGDAPPVSWFAPWPRTADEMPLRASEAAAVGAGKEGSE